MILHHRVPSIIKTIRHRKFSRTMLIRVLLVRSGRVELPLSAPEANVLSTGLRARFRTLYIIAQENLFV